VSGVRLETEIGGGLRLKNPVLTASGTCGYGLELEPFMDLSRLGGIVVKGLSPRSARRQSPGAHRRDAVGDAQRDRPAEHRRAGLRRGPPARGCGAAGRRSSRTSSASGSRTTWKVAGVLRDADGLSAIEVNLSCPNTAEGGMIFGIDPASVERVTRVVKDASRVPVLVKLTPNVTDITEIARAAVAGGRGRAVPHQYLRRHGRGRRAARAGPR
jgi:dihydroorotate dehydrogenase (NAD+) catalytic subunit